MHHAVSGKGRYPDQQKGIEDYSNIPEGMKRAPYFEWRSWLRQKSNLGTLAQMCSLNFSDLKKACVLFDILFCILFNNLFFTKW